MNSVEGMVQAKLLKVLWEEKMLQTPHVLTWYVYKLQIYFDPNIIYTVSLGMGVVLVYVTSLILSNVINMLPKLMFDNVIQHLQLNILSKNSLNSFDNRNYCQ